MRRNWNCNREKLISFAAARQTGGSNPKVSRDKSSREAGEKTVLTHEPQNLSGHGTPGLADFADPTDLQRS